MPEHQQQPDASDVCFICLSCHSDSDPLSSPCGCRMFVHQACLARWQLQNAGSSGERECRFCKGSLPDWRDAHVDLPQAAPILTIMHGGEKNLLSASPGVEGMQDFQACVRAIFGLEAEEQIHLTFTCTAPGSGAQLNLEGWASYDAALTCAAISSAQRCRQTATAARDGSRAEPAEPPREANAGLKWRAFQRSLARSWRVCGLGLLVSHPWPVLFP